MQHHLCGEQSVTAADVERGPCTPREFSEDRVVVLDVVVSSPVAFGLRPLSFAIFPRQSSRAGTDRLLILTAGEKPFESSFDLRFPLKAFI